MNECPNYYLTASGQQFYEFYSENCTPIVVGILTHDQSHALASACEYLFRAGRKTPDPREDFRKAMSLFLRIDDLVNEDSDTEAITEVVDQVLGQVLRAKLAAEIAEVPQVVDLSQGGPFDEAR